MNDSILFVLSIQIIEFINITTKSIHIYIILIIVFSIMVIIIVVVIVIAVCNAVIIRKSKQIICYNFDHLRRKNKNARL